MEKKTFADLGLSPEILKTVEKKGFTHPSPIQEGVIPLLIKGEKDIIGQAQTGTGKTAAFALPLLEKLDPNLKKTQAIILAPTRELAIQVVKEIESFRSPTHSPTVSVVYGGNPMHAEISALKRNPQIVVGTPGRMQHHIRNKNLRLDTITYFVLDEADEMLNFGFREEIEEILEMTPPHRRVLLFSATMPKSIMSIVHNYMKDYETVKVKAQEMTNENITQKYFCVRNRDKFNTLCRIIENETHFYAIVFCRTKSDVDIIANQMIMKHMRAEAIHGDIDQSQREKVLARFRSGKTQILVATDVAARGIDIAELNFVINYSIPENHEIYTHRIGRTGRAGNTGTAITLIDGRDMHRLDFFAKKLNTTIKKGVLPTPENLIEKKKEHLIERLEYIVNNKDISYLIPFAKQLLEEKKAEKIIAAFIKKVYGDDFNPKNYKIIEEDKPSRSGWSDRNRRGGRFSSNRNRSSSSGGYRGGNSGGSRRSSGGGYKWGGRSGEDIAFWSGYRGNSSRKTSGGGYREGNSGGSLRWDSRRKGA